MRAISIGLLMTAVALLVPEPATAQVAAGAVTAVLRVDRADVAVYDDDSGPAPVLTYEVSVANTGGDLVPGLAIVADLPAALARDGGGAVRLPLADLAPGATATARFEATVDRRGLDGSEIRVAARVVGAGVDVAAGPAVTRVAHLVGAVTIERPTDPAPAPTPTPTPAPAPVVAGVTVTRPAAEAAPATLAATGVDAALAVGAAVVAVASGLALAAGGRRRASH